VTEHEDHKSAADRILDLVVFGPAGLALTAAEEFPKLAEKGRHRVEGQVHTARLVGQFAVQMGRRQIETTVGNLLSGHRPGAPVATPASPPAPSSSSAGPTRSAAQDPPPGVSAPAAGNGALASDALGIPGYDSLSASQVVQRLEGLSVDELEAIRRHELAHRHRRTILNRVEQLLGVPGQGA
jgi:hypothetical protein